MNQTVRLAVQEQYLRGESMIEKWHHAQTLGFDAHRLVVHKVTSQGSDAPFRCQTGAVYDLTGENPLRSSMRYRPLVTFAGH